MPFYFSSYGFICELRYVSTDACLKESGQPGSFFNAKRIGIFPDKEKVPGRTLEPYDQN